MLKRYHILYKLIITLSIIGLVLPNFSLAQEEVPVPKIKAPETIEEAKEFGKKFFQKVQEQLPGILKNLWKERVLATWKKMYQIWSDWWDCYLQPRIRNIWQKFLRLFSQEIEKRKPQLEEEFEKEKEELKEEIKEEIPEVKKSFWERFKELIR
jgi:hypothetical protein